MITSISEFQSILRAVAVHHKPADLCNRLNSFAVVDRMTQLNADNAEMIMQHYTDGLFWARDWYNKGAKPQALSKEYDMLVLEAVKGARKADLTDRGFIATFYLVVVGLVNPGEKQCPCTVESKRAAVMQTLNEVATELMSYQRYLITPATGDAFTGWATEAQAAALIEAGTWLDADWQGLRLDSAVMQEGWAYYVPEWNSLSPFRGNTTGRTTLVDNVVAVATEINLEICNPNPGNTWKYDTANVASLGVVRCDEC